MSQAICVSCGEKAHSPPCQSSPHCINCDGPHGLNSRDCPKFQMEREIQKIRATDKVSFPEVRHHYQAQHPVSFSRNFVSVLKSFNTTSSSSQTMRPTPRSVHFKVTVVRLVGDQDKNPQLLKIITLTVKPTAVPQGAEPSSSSALSSTDLPTSTSSSERPPRRTISPSARSSRQGSRSKSQSPVGNTTATRDSSPSDTNDLTSIDDCSSQVLGRKKSHRSRRKL